LLDRIGESCGIESPETIQLLVNVAIELIQRVPGPTRTDDHHNISIAALIHLPKSDIGSLDSLSHLSNTRRLSPETSPQILPYQGGISVPIPYRNGDIENGEFGLLLHRLLRREMFSCPKHRLEHHASNTGFDVARLLTSPVHQHDRFHSGELRYELR